MVVSGGFNDLFIPDSLILTSKINQRRFDIGNFDTPSLGSRISIFTALYKAFLSLKNVKIYAHL